MKKKEGQSSMKQLRFILGGDHQSTQLMMDSEDDKTSGKSWLMSIRKMMQRPDVNSIEILSWLRSKQKSRNKAMRQQNREWSRFMSGYIGSNANANTNDIR